VNVIVVLEPCRQQHDNGCGVRQDQHSSIIVFEGFHEGFRDAVRFRRTDWSEADEARNLLTPVYGWFTEGFNARDLKEVKTLLDELRA
jgi:hypothetical protein